MDAFYERLIVRAATIDELLSADFEPLPGQKGDADLAGRRLAAWCRSCASGNWSLFERRLMRDGLTLAQALTRFASIRRKPSARAAAMDRRRDLDRGGIAKRWRRRQAARCARPGRTLRVRTPAGAGRGRSRGAALLERRCARTEQLDRIRPRQPAPFAARRTVRPHGAGALRALRPGAKGRSRAVRLRQGRCNPPRHRATISLSPK